jgi:hypothetical protein
MKETPLKLRIPYAQSFIPPRGRKMRTAWFLDEDAVMIRAIEPDEAPVAYRVGSKPLPLDPGARREYAIRSFEGKLWWPLSWHEGPAMNSGQFAVIAAQGIPIAVLAIDPSIAVPLRCWPLGLFGKDPVREEGDSDKGERWAWAQRNATRVVFCGGEVLVEAGEPVFYALPYQGGVDIEIGPSAWDRRNERHAMPGPDREQRRDCARRGLAFGIDELEKAAPKRGRRTARGDRRQFLTMMSPDVIKAVKQAAIADDRAAWDIMEEAAKQWLDRRRGRRAD